MTEGDGGSQVLVISCHLNDFFHIYFRFGKHMNKILKKTTDATKVFMFFSGCLWFFQVPKSIPKSIPMIPGRAPALGRF